jgi:enolase
MDAVSHIEGVLAKAFVGRQIGKLGSLLDTDRELLGLELAEATRIGRIQQSATKEQKIQVMQRKGALGMNAILSMSLALGRAVAAGQGRELWQLIREMSADTMSKFVAANAKGEKRSAADLKKMDYDQLQALFRKTAADAIKEGKTLYELLRAQLPVYPV